MSLYKNPYPFVHSLENGIFLHIEQTDNAMLCIWFSNGNDKMEEQNIPVGFELQVRPRSGLALKNGITVLNTPGTVDSGYRGEVKVILYNSTQNSIQIKLGQKIAQACICPVVNGKWINLEETSDISEKDRGENGFGSTGV